MEAARSPEAVGWANAKANVEALKAAGINSHYYESPLTAHEWLSWRRSLHEFAPLLFQDQPLPSPIVQSTAAPTPGAPAPAATMPAAKTLRIKAGQSTPFTDSSGQVWLAEQGFEGGDTIDRDPETKIAGTKDSGLFLSEHYSMESFSCKIPNGKYTVKLYFAETFDGITGPGERVFSFNVQGREFKNFDIWVKAGGFNRAYVETVPVEVTSGILRITFTPQVENPEINAIEIIPQSTAETGAVAPAPAVKTVAGDVSGTWKSEFDSQIGRQQYTFTFKQDGAKLTGKANSEAGDRKREAELKEGKVDGDKISFGEMLSIQDNEIRIDYTGKLSADGNEIKFTRQVGDFAKTEIVAKRVQSATTATAVAAKSIRIKAGKSEPVKDAEGNVWLADQGFEGGETDRKARHPDCQHEESRPLPGRTLQHEFIFVAGAQREVRGETAFRGNVRGHHRSG